MSGTTIVFIDDDPKYLRLIVNDLRLKGVEVLPASTGARGLELVRTRRPDLLLLDLELGDNERDGFQLCAEIRSWNDPDLKTIPVLILTKSISQQDHQEALQKYGADGFLSQPIDPDVIFANIEAQLRRVPRPPFPQDGSVVLGLTVAHKHPVHVTLTHAMEFVGVTKDNLDLDPARWGRLAHPSEAHAFRARAKDDGQRIWEALMRPEVLAKYREERGRNPQNLRLRFPGPRDFLRVPLECAFDPIDERYLVLTHPVARSVTDTPRNTSPLSPVLLNRLWAERRPLRVLLIAANTWVPGGLSKIPGADTEIELLRTKLPEWFRNYTKGKLDVEITTLPSQEASATRAAELLRNCQFDIVHYAGHAIHDRAHPEESSLIFWEDQPGGKLAFVRASELGLWLERSNIAFMYLSTCEGAASAQGDALFEEDFLGVADAIVKAGVPALLGFRWPVADALAATLCSAFYQSLAAQGQLDTALFTARREVYGRSANDPTWLSAILIMQG